MEVWGFPVPHKSIPRSRNAPQLTGPRACAAPLTSPSLPLIWSPGGPPRTPPPPASARLRSCPRLSSCLRCSCLRLRLPFENLLHVLQPDELFSLPLLESLLNVPDRGHVPRNYHVLQ